MGPRRARALAAAALASLTLILTAAACGGGSLGGGSSPEPPPPDAAAATDTSRALAPCERPYSDDSAWNTPIGESPSYHPDSASFVAGIEAPLTSDPTQFTYPVYEVSGDTPLRTVALEGWFSSVVARGARLENQRGGTVELPIPPGARPADGFDAQIVLLDPETGNEWGASLLSENADGSFEAWSAYRYNVGWSALAPYDDEDRPIWACGAGIPYLAGLIRPCEIAQRRIDHALALSCDSPCNAFVHPATKSDGASTSPNHLPEGARLQLDPTITELEIRSWEYTGPCFTVARALQEYGMIVVDNGGRSKIYFEFEGTAGWDGQVDQDTVSPIRADRLLVLDFGEPTLDE
jgi:hypothetical protein